MSCRGIVGRCAGWAGRWHRGCSILKGMQHTGHVLPCAAPLPEHTVLSFRPQGEGPVYPVCMWVGVCGMCVVCKGKSVEVV